ncbi:MAG: hypothetical protein V4608_00595 [Bacteroidota bacterium]
MKRLCCFFFVFVFLGISVSFAQGAMTLQQRKTAANTVYLMVKQYLKASKLQKAGVPGITEEKKQAFLSLFEEDAVVWDDITPINFPNKILYNEEKTIDNLIADYEKYFPEGLTIKNLNSTINFKNLPNKTAQIAIQRNISGEYMGEYFISNPSVVLELELKLSDDYTSAKITGIKKRISNPITCATCPKPAVAVVTPSKDPIKVKAEKTPLEKPGITLGFNFSASGNSVTMEAPDLAKMNYESLIANKNSIRGFSAKGGLAITAGMDVNVMFGKTKKWGIGPGLFFNYSKAKLKYDTIHQVYKGQNEGDLPDFMRFYTAYDISENISMNNLGISVLLKYNSGTDKTGFYFDCGPVFILSSTASSKYSTTADYEAIYQYNGSGYFFDPAVGIDRNDWVMTKKAFNESDQNTQTEAEYFASLADFNVGIDKKDDGQSGKFKFKQAYGGLIKAGVSMPISETIQFLAGINIMYLKIQNNNSYNQPLAENMGTYNSTLSAVNAISNLNVGINVGLVVKLYKSAGKTK